MSVDLIARVDSSTNYSFVDCKYARLSALKNKQAKLPSQTAGSFRMGLLHGAYCLGCNWFLIAALFPLGMTVGAMAVITLVILAEKMLPWPTSASYTAGVVLVLYGAVLIASPLLTMH